MGSGKVGAIEEKLKTETQLQLDRIEEGMKKIFRHLDIHRKLLDNLDSDREIFEQIQGKLTGIEEQVRLSRQHDTQAKREITNEINGVKDNVGAKVEEIGEQLAQKKVITIKKYPKWMFWRR